jgi:hypothetical protein
MARKNVMRMKCTELILQALLELEKEFEMNREIESFESKNVFCKQTELVEYCRNLTGCKKSTVINAIKELAGGTNSELKSLTDEQVQNQYMIYKDKTSHCYRLTKKGIKELTSFSHPKDKWVTPLPSTDQLYLKTKHGQAPILSDKLNKYFAPNNIQTFSLNENLLLCLNLEIPPEWDKAEKYDFRKQIESAIIKLGYDFCDYGLNQSDFPGWTEQDLQEQRQQEEEEFMEWQLEEQERSKKENELNKISPNRKRPQIKKDANKKRNSTDTDTEETENVSEKK